MLEVRWAAAVVSAVGATGNLLLISVYLVRLYRFPKRTLNILSLMVCDLGNSALSLIMHTADRNQVTTHNNPAT